MLNSELFMYPLFLNNYKNVFFFRFNDGRRKMRVRNVDKVKVVGTCCAKLFKGIRYRGRNHFLGVGFDDAPDFSQIRSLKIGRCNKL